MKISYETSLWALVRDSKLWSAGQTYAEKFTIGELDNLEAFLEEVYPDGIDLTSLNDLFRFDTELAAQWAGISLESFQERFWEVDENDLWKWNEDESN